MGASALWLVPPHKRGHLAGTLRLPGRTQHVGQATGGIDVYPITGVPKNICAGYGNRPKPDGTFALHDACDLCAPTGTPAIAVTDGVVSYGTDPFGGNVAILRTPDGSTGYYYAHLRDVQTGQRAVKTGEQIAVVDMTGNAAKVGIPHVHFQVWPGGQFNQGSVHPDPTSDLMAAPMLAEPIDTNPASSKGWLYALLLGVLGIGVGAGSYLIVEGRA